jgi:hypothetical protein
MAPQLKLTKYLATPSKMSNPQSWQHGCNSRLGCGTAEVTTMSAAATATTVVVNLYHLEGHVDLHGQQS